MLNFRLNFITFDFCLDVIEEEETFSFGIHKPKIFSIEEADYTNETIIFDSYRLVCITLLKV